MDDKQAVAGVKRAETWLIQHERIVLFAMVLLVIAFGINKLVDRAAATDSVKAVIAESVAAAQHDADVKLAAAVAQQQAQFNQAQQARDQEMASLITAVTSRDAASSQRISAVTQSKDVPQAVVDVNTAYGAALPTPLTVAEAGSIPIADLQQFSVAKIEQGTLESDLADTRKELANAAQGLQQSTALVNSLNTQVSGLQTELTDERKAAKAEIALAKAQARKGKRNWFIAGFVLGLVAHYAH